MQKLQRIVTLEVLSFRPYPHRLVPPHVSGWMDLLMQEWCGNCRNGRLVYSLGPNHE
uniref:Uncharacterized protein n=1 Tax=Solanum tuberosum TaxID=4113 RepID=M1CYD7_SOLTU